MRTNGSVTELTELRDEIVRRYGTVYRFCKRTGFSRSVAYKLVRGVYPGNVDRQVARARDALSGATVETVLFTAVKRAACGRCSVQGECHRCDGLFQAQARAAAEVFQTHK